jgi:hypothetical protein
MTNARPFSIFTFQDLFNDTKNTSMRGVWALLSSSEHSGVLEDSKSPTLQVLVFTPTLGQSGVATAWNYGLGFFPCEKGLMSLHLHIGTPIFSFAHQ